MSQGIDFDRVKQDSVGRWHGIYLALGVEVGDGRHTACPVCGGTDRFRMDDKEGKGTYFCNQCGSGDGFGLLQKILNCDFKEAIEQVAQIVGSINRGKINEKQTDPKMLRELFKKSCKISKSDTAGQYLQSRGLKSLPQNLRFCPSCWEPETKTNIPAMLAIVTSEDSEAVTMHRTFLDPVTIGQNKMLENTKKIMPPLKKITGGAIRLFEPASGAIGIAEGIETAIACHDRFAIPTWSAISSTLLESFEPPKGIRKVYVFGDNDANFAGQKAAYALANRLVVRKKIEAEVIIPPKLGDWLDNIDEF